MNDYLNRSIEVCKLCPQTEGKKELGWGVKEQIMFIGQSPSPNNFEGKQGDSEFDLYFLRLLQPVGITKEMFYFTNLVKSPIRRIRDLERKTLTHCSEHLIDEYLNIKPKVVVALGKYAERYTRVPNLETMPHPSAIKYGTLTEEQWVDSLRRVLRNSFLLTKDGTYKYVK